MITRSCLFIVCFAYLFTAGPEAVMAKKEAESRQNYVGFSAGVVSDNYLTGELQSDDNSTDQNNYSDEDLAPGYMLSLKIGRTTPPPEAFAAIELEGLIISGTDIEDNEFYYREFALGADVRVNADISLQAVMTNLYLRDPRGTLQPYVGFGLGWAWLDIDMDLTLQQGRTWPGTGSSSGEISTSDSDYALQLLLGFDWYMTNRLALDIGYRYFHTQATITDRIGTTNFDIDTTYNTHMLTAGLKYLF